MKMTFVALLFLLGLLAYTNPQMDGYARFVQQNIAQETGKQGDWTKALGVLFGGFASDLYVNATIRKDYVFLSTYETNLGKEHIQALGVLNNFIVLQSP